MKNKKKVLIIEDEDALAKALKFKLTNAGYDVALAHDGKLGFDMIKEGSFDLILLDLVMPKMDGFEMLQEIKNNNIHANIIVLSNLGQESDIAAVKALGAKKFLIKSDTQLEQILEEIKRLTSS